MSILWRRILAVAAAFLGVAWGSTLIMLSLATVASAASWSTLASALPGVHLAGNHALGRSDAPVKIVIYSDFQCRYCESLHRVVEPELVRRYVALGKARLEVRQYPALGPDSVRAAEAALCAADQGYFWEYRHALYAAWRQVGPGTHSAEGLKNVATLAGLNGDVLAECLDAGRHRAEVQQELQEARADGIQSLPTVLINGHRVEGAKPLDDFVRLIEEELAK